MTSIHHDLDLISQVDGWGTMTWHHRALPVGDLHRAPRRRLRATVQDRCKGLVALVAAWHERARQRRTLQQLSTHMLRDIGIDREAALAEACKPFWRP